MTDRLRNQPALMAPADGRQKGKEAFVEEGTGFLVWEGPELFAGGEPVEVHPGLVAGPQVLDPLPVLWEKGHPVSSPMGRGQRTNAAQGHQALQRQDIGSIPGLATSIQGTCLMADRHSCLQKRPLAFESPH